MKLVADEGVDQPNVAALRTAGHDVVYFAELAPSSDDTLVLQHANHSATLLPTCDNDFGELVFRNRLTTAGVVLIRLHGLSTPSKAAIIVAAIEQHGRETLSAFTAVAPGQLRVRTRTVP